MAFGGSPKPPPPPAPIAPAPTIDEAAIKSQQEQDDLIQRQQMGRASTILNGGAGLSNTGTVASASQLLGG